MKNLKKLSSKIRYEIIEMCHKSKSAHLASSLSCVDILVVLLWRILRIKKSKTKIFMDKDKMIVSKGHAAMAIYSSLSERGFFSKKILRTYNKDGGILAEHPPANILNGIDVATGSLGHGLPVSAGYALGCKVKKSKAKVFVIMSDGELNEGSNWEAAMFAAANNLDNLIVIVDHNKWQATDRSNLTLGKLKLKDKWKSFGWNATEVDGHNHNKLEKAINKQKKNKPLVIIADTIKGKGIKVMEDDNNWHYRVPTKNEVLEAKKELNLL